MVKFKLKSPKIKYTGGSRPDFPSGFSLLKPSWQAIKINLITILELILIPILLSTAAVIIFRSPAEVAYVQEVARNPQATPVIGPGVISSFIATVISTLLVGAALTLTLLKSTRGEKIDFLQAIKQSGRFFWRHVFVVVATGLAVLICLAPLFATAYLASKQASPSTIYEWAVVATLPLMVLAIVLVQRLLLGPFYVVARDDSAIDSMKASSRAARRSGWALWQIMGVSVLFAMLNYIPTLGTILSLMFSIAYAAAPALRYRQFDEAKLS